MEDAEGKVKRPARCGWEAQSQSSLRKDGTFSNKDGALSLRCYVSTEEIVLVFTELCPVCQEHLKGFTCLNSFNPHSSQGTRHYFYSHSTKLEN